MGAFYKEKTMKKIIPYLLFTILIFSTFFAFVFCIDPIDNMQKILSICSALFNIWILFNTKNILKLPSYVFWFFVALNGLFLFKSLIFNQLYFL